MLMFSRIGNARDWQCQWHAIGIAIAIVWHCIGIALALSRRDQ